MSKFKKGDRVRVVRLSRDHSVYDDGIADLIGLPFTVERVSDDCVHAHGRVFFDEDLELCDQHPKHGTDERGWPLVPCDPAAIPEGYEAVRVGWPKVGEVAASLDKSVVSWTLNYAEDISPRLIIRPIPKPIRLPLAIVPEGWWVCRDMNGNVFVHETNPTDRICNGQIWPLPPWIAAELPREWHELPWDQSAVQQKEGGEG